jgi:flagellar biosynthesis/type III secretory pathway M-ring protein FliF/YscJ
MTMLFNIFLIILSLFVLYYFCIKPGLENTKQEKKAARLPAKPEEVKLPPRKMTDKERLTRLSKTDPDRAKDLIQQWIREKDT